MKKMLKIRDIMIGYDYNIKRNQIKYDGTYYINRRYYDKISKIECMRLDNKLFTRGNKKLLEAGL